MEDRLTQRYLLIQYMDYFLTFLRTYSAEALYFCMATQYCEDELCYVGLKKLREIADRLTEEHLDLRVGFCYAGLDTLEDIDNRLNALVNKIITTQTKYIPAVYKRCSPYFLPYAEVKSLRTTTASGQSIEDLKRLADDKFFKMVKDKGIGEAVRDLCVERRSWCDAQIIDSKHYCPRLALYLKRKGILVDGGEYEAHIGERF